MHQSPLRGGDYVLPRNTILNGDVRDLLPGLPTASVDCIITSPPYFGARDYGHGRQLGIEPSIANWVDELRAVCRQLARILRPSGSLWLNVGDSYARHIREGAAPKSLLLGPARLALGLCADGWILRNQVIWAKTNPMPSSIPDRLSPTYEIVYFFVQARRYYFDLDAIRQPLRSASSPASGDPARTYPPVNARVKGRTNHNHGLATLRSGGLAGHPLGKNPGDVWSLPTAGFRGGHFAAYPKQLVERPLLAGCPERVCTRCHAPWRRTALLQEGAPRLLATGPLRPTCQCRCAAEPGVVLDPFIGAGTTALVAQQHGRDWVGVELNPDFVTLANQRIRRARHEAQVGAETAAA